MTDKQTTAPAPRDLDQIAADIQAIEDAIPTAPPERLRGLDETLRSLLWEFHAVSQAAARC
jgi:hypothetical protein